MSEWEDEAYPVKFTEWYNNEYLPNQDEYGRVGMDKAIYIWRALQEQKLEGERREAEQPQENKTKVLNSVPHSVEDDLNLQADSLAKTNEDIARQREVDKIAAERAVAKARSEEGLLGKPGADAANDPKNYINSVSNGDWNNIKSVAEALDNIANATEYFIGDNQFSNAAFGQANNIKNMIGNRSLSEYDKVRGSIDKGIREKIFSPIYKPLSYIEIAAEARKAEKEALAAGASPEEAKSKGQVRLLLGLGILTGKGSLGKLGKTGDWSIAGKAALDGGIEALAEVAKSGADKIVQGDSQFLDKEAAQDGFIQGVIKGILDY